MRLISLTSNKQTFKPVRFNRNGLSIIYGRREERETDDGDKGKTFNGIGKSLAVFLIDFCLGSQKNKALDDHLVGWEFFLELEFNGVAHIISRPAEMPQTPAIDGKSLKVEELRKWLREKSLEGSPPPSFRSVVLQFLRPYRASYTSFRRLHTKDQDYDGLLRAIFLLGLDTELVVTKRQLKEAKSKTSKSRQIIKKDTLLKESLTQSGGAITRLRDIQKRLAQLNESKNQFKVAEDYHQIEKEANSLKRDLQFFRNEAIVTRNALDNVARSLKAQPDISVDSVVRLYNEASAALPDSLVRSLQEVEAFHNQLLHNRLNRLTAEQRRLQVKLGQLEEERVNYSAALDKKLDFLGSHRALDEYAAITNEISELQTQASKLDTYQTLIQKYNSEFQNLKVSLAQQAVETDEYLLGEGAAVLEENSLKFRELAGEFYPERPGDILVRNNTRDNMIRFDLDVHLEDDQSDGINSIKIFCYDMTLLVQQHRHCFRFLCHDSRLFGHPDFRQRAEILKLAQGLCEEGDFQYIISLNEDQVESMRGEFSEAEFRSIVLDSVVLELTDESAESKLLGIQVDMKYEDDA